MKKLLFISPTFPYPPDKGWHIRILNLVMACSEVFEVTLVAPPAPSDEARAHLEKFCKNIITVERATRDIPTSERLKFSLRMMESIDSGRARTMASFGDALAKIDLGAFDAIWVERKEIYTFVCTHGDKTVLDLDDLEHKKFWREIKLRKGALTKLKAIPRLTGMFLWDVFVARSARAVLVCSNEDKTYLRSFGVSHAEFVPNGTAIEFAGNKYDPRIADRMAVFLGNMEYKANMDAVIYFDREILPLLKKTTPGFILDVIGPKPADTSQVSSSIRFLGFVDDIASELRNYKTMIVPLRYGGGTKLKVIDAMAAGVPIVTTSIGAEGLNIEQARHALITDTPDTFASAIETVSRDPELAAKLSQNAYELAEKHYSWKNIRANAAAWLNQLMR